jgi:hypothetical protein
MFEEVWESKPIMGYRNYVDTTYNIIYEWVSPSVLYKTFTNKNTGKNVKIKNYVYKYFSTYTYEGVTKSFDREKKEQIRGEVNFILKILKTTI